jgi:dsDNA-specific endonuclease/ATPase MutS2
MNKKLTVGHTPGPWHFHGGWGCMVKAGEASIAECRQQLKHSEIVANAKLIAAAPDLLAACQAALEEIQHFSFGTVKQISDAISKATDETDD